MIPVRLAAKQLGISHERMRQYIRAGRVPGAVHDPHFSRWLVPADFVVLPPKSKVPKAAPPKKAEKEEIKEKQHQQSKLSA